VCGLLYHVLCHTSYFVFRSCYVVCRMLSSSFFFSEYSFSFHISSFFMFFFRRSPFVCLLSYFLCLRSYVICAMFVCLRFSFVFRIYFGLSHMFPPIVIMYHGRCHYVVFHHGSFFLLCFFVIMSSFVCFHSSVVVIMSVFVFRRYTFVAVRYVVFVISW